MGDSSKRLVGEGSKGRKLTTRRGLPSEGPSHFPVVCCRHDEICVETSSRRQSHPVGSDHDPLLVR